MSNGQQNIKPADRRGPKRDSNAMLRAAREISEVASEDARLVSEAQSGRRQAFARLFEKYRDTSYQIAYRFLGHQQDALDVVQESFTKAFVGLEKFRGGSSFKTWLYRIVTNSSLDRRRSRMVRKSASLDVDDAPDPPDHSHESDQPWQNLQRQELKGLIDDALASIPENNRTAFVLFAVEGVSYREIADILNISIGTVMSRIFYARQKLQRILAGHEPAVAVDVDESAGNEDEHQALEAVPQESEKESEDIQESQNNRPSGPSETDDGASDEPSEVPGGVDLTGGPDSSGGDDAEATDGGDIEKREEQ